MRGRSTWLLLAALIGLAVVAAVDALRGGDREPERVGTVATTSPAADLRRAGVTGVLYFSVTSEGACILHARTLPSLQNAASFGLQSCIFDVSHEGAVVSGPPCGRRRAPVDVFWTAAQPPTPFAGCAPAWKPNGELTFVRDGDVVTPTETLVQDVTRFARPALGAGGRLAVRQLAWLSDTRLAAVVAARAVASNVVVMVENGRPISEPIFTDQEATIQVSADSEEVFVGGSNFGVQVFNRNGAFVSGNRFPFLDIAAVAESPEGDWVALARPANVCIYPEIEPPPRERFPVACLPFDAVDLAWR
jgi:hypothetical protein